MRLVLVAASLLSTPALAADVVTMNAWGLPEPIAPDRRDRLPLIADFVRERTPDLVAFQEVWRGAVSLLGLDGLRREGRDGDSGLALWSPHPVRDVRAHTFRAARSVDAWKDKGVLAATVDFPDLGVVRVLVTHLQAGDGSRNAAVRAAQVEQILSLVDDRPTMVLGDFNFYVDEPLDVASAGRLAERGLVDAAVHLGSIEPTYPGSSHRFDQVWLAGLVPTALEVIAYDDDPRTRNPPRLSDHRPVRVGIEVP